MSTPLRFALFAPVALLPTLMYAQGFGHLDINAINARFNAHGLVGSATGTGQPYFEVPQGSGMHAVYSAGPWVSGISTSGSLHLAAQQFESVVDGDFWPGPLGAGAGITTAISQQYDRVWTVLHSEILAHRAYFDCLSDPGCDVNVQFPGGYVIPPDFLSWPAMGDVTVGQSTYLAPFTDYNGDGTYNASDGDHPCVPGDMALYFIFNDQRPHVHSGGLPIGLEFHCLAYAFDTPDQALAHTVFINYRIINRSTLTLSDTYLGMFADFDLGNPTDDHVGTDARRNLVYTYNADNHDESTSFYQGYGTEPPAIGLMQLRGTLLDADATDNPTDGLLPSFNGSGFADGNVDNERYGYTVTKTYNNGPGALGGPAFAYQFRAHMTGRWNDNSLQYYGGNGHWSDPGTDTSTVSRFCFPAISDPPGAGTGGVPQAPWSEVALSNPGGDRRILASQGPFTLEPGQTRQLHMAFIWARATSGGPWASVQALQARADSVLAFFLDSLATYDPEDVVWCPMDFTQGLTGPTGLSYGLQVYPVPAQDVLFIQQSGRPLAAEVQVFDALGRSVAIEAFVQVPSQLSISALTPGHYVLLVRTAEGTGYARFVKE